MKKTLLVGTVFAAGLLVLLHHHSQAGNVQDVHAVLANAQALVGKDIAVAGVAETNFAVLDIGGFVLKDSDGSTLTVVSGSGVPLAGTHVSVHGVLRQAFVRGGQQTLILIEDSPNPESQETR